LKIKAPDASVLAAVSPIERVKSHRDG
jgi:hypothetical protein